MLQFGSCQNEQEPWWWKQGGAREVREKPRHSHLEKAWWKYNSISSNARGGWQLNYTIKLLSLCKSTFSQKLIYNPFLWSFLYQCCDGANCEQGFCSFVILNNKIFRSETSHLHLQQCGWKRPWLLKRASGALRGRRTSSQDFLWSFCTNSAVAIARRNILVIFFPECLEATSLVQKLVTCTNNVGWKKKGHGPFHLTRSMLARTSFNSSFEVYNHHPTRLMV